MIDIRTGYDSTNYSSAGEAVREQVSDLNDKFTAIYDGYVSDTFLDKQLRYYNLCDKSKITVGYYIKRDNTTIEMNNRYGYSDYIKIDGDTNYIAFHPWNSNDTVLIYDGDKNLIQALRHVDLTPLDENIEQVGTAIYWYTFKTPTNAEYIRVNLSLVDDVRTMVIKGNSSTNIPETYVQHEKIILSNEFKDYLYNIYGAKDIELSNQIEAVQKLTEKIIPIDFNSISNDAEHRDYCNITYNDNGSIHITCHKECNKSSGFGIKISNQYIDFKNKKIKLLFKINSENLSNKNIYIYEYVSMYTWSTNKHMYNKTNPNDNENGYISYISHSFNNIISDTVYEQIIEVTTDKFNDDDTYNLVFNLSDIYGDYTVDFIIYDITNVIKEIDL